MGRKSSRGDQGIEFATPRDASDIEGAIGSDTETDGDELAVDGTVTSDGGTDDGLGDAIDPRDIDRDAPYGRTASGRVRKRPVGSGRRSASGRASKKDSQSATNTIAEILMMLHWGIATALKEPALELTQDECEKGAASITRLTELYGDIPGMDEKTMAWVNLAGTWGTIYGTRFIAIRARKKQPSVITMR